MTGDQLRAARAMLRWEQAELAERAGVSTKTIKRLEANSGVLEARSTWSIQDALESGGIEFLQADLIEGRGDGVRFFPDRNAKLRRTITEHVARSVDVVLLMAVRDGADLYDRPASEIAKMILLNIGKDLEATIRAVVPGQR